MLSFRAVFDFDYALAFIADELGPLLLPGLR